MNHTESFEKAFETSNGISPQNSGYNFLESNRVRFEPWWHKIDDNTPAHTRAIQDHCSRPTASHEFFKNVIRNTARKDECILSLNVPTVPRQNSVEWSDCTRNRQERRQTKHVTSRPRIRKKAERYPDQKSWQPRIFPDGHQTWHADTMYEINLVRAQEFGSKIPPSIRWHSTRMYLLHGSLDEMKRSCTNDHHKSHRTQRHSKTISGLWVTVCFTQTRNKKDSILSGIVLIPFYKLFTE